MNNEKNSLLYAARAYNFLRLMACSSYGDIGDFIKDGLPKCLEDNIIPEMMANDSFFIGMDRHKTDVKYKNPFSPFKYDMKDEDFIWGTWKFNLVKINLPESMKLETCKCGNSVTKVGVYNNDELIRVYNVLDYLEPINSVYSPTILSM